MKAAGDKIVLGPLVGTMTGLLLLLAIPFSGLLWPHPVGAAAVHLDGSRAFLLAGDWFGTIVSCDKNSCVLWRTDLRMSFVPGPPATVRWYSRAYSSSWQSEATFANGKLVLSYRGRQIPFLLQRSATGRLSLIGRYRSRWFWSERWNTISLYRQVAGDEAR